MAGKRSFGAMGEGEIDAFTSRLREVVAKIGSQARAAEVAGVSLAQLKNYLTGTSSPPLLPIQRLVEAAETDMVWLVHGTGPEAAKARATLSRGVEVGRLVGALEPLRKVYADEGFAFAGAEEEAATLGAAIDCVMAHDDMSIWPALARVVIDAQRIALHHAARVTRRRRQVKD